MPRGVLEAERGDWPEVGGESEEQGAEAAFRGGGHGDIVTRGWAGGRDHL
jgi:hypothetical protein